MRTRSSADLAATAPPVEHALPPPPPRVRRALVLDGVGVGLACALAVWTYVAAAFAGGDAGPTMALLAGCVAVYVAVRLLPSGLRPLAPLAVIAVATVVVLRSPVEVYSESPSVVPFGYAHFTWALFVQAAVAGLMLAVTRGPLVVRILMAAAALGLATVPFGARIMGAATLLMALIAAIALGRARLARVAVVAAGAALCVALIATTILALRYTGHERHGSIDALLHATANGCRGSECSPAGVEGIERSIYQAVAERRIAMWDDALVLMSDHPVAGVGPGRFQAESPIAVADRDEPWVHHEFFQQGAETGWPGLVLLVLLFLWGVARLAAMRRPDAVAVLGAVGLLLLGLHACLDFVLHHPVAPLAAAALLGFATSDRERKG